MMPSGDVIAMLLAGGRAGRMGERTGDCRECPSGTSRGRSH